MKIKGRKVLVTGSEGFIGSHLVERLLDEGCRIRAFVYYNFSNSWGWLEALPERKLKEIEIFTGDVRDPNGTRKAMENIDVVFHLAALIGVPFSYHSPDSYTETNIKGTTNILQAARDAGVKKVMVTSTSEVYGTAKYVPIDEKHPRQGQSPYAATKIGADYMAEAFYRSYGLPLTIMRPFNTYGPRQSARAIIPSIIIQLLSGMRKIELGALHPLRDFIFVKDVAEGMLSMAKSDKTIGEEMNIATRTEISIGDLAQKLITMINPDARVVMDEERLRPKKSEVERLLGNNEKIMKLTHWKPRYSLNEGLEETVAWFKNKKNIEHYKADIYNV